MSSLQRPNALSAWRELDRMATSSPPNLASLLADVSRQQSMVFQAAGITVDVSRQRVNSAIMESLISLAQQMGVMKQAQKMFSGEPINYTENRAALHVALRGVDATKAPWSDAVSCSVSEQSRRFLNFAQRVRDGRLHGFQDQPITDIVNLGIGGSDLGPRMVTQALQAHAPTEKQPVSVHYVSNPDPVALEVVLSRLEPSTTAFIVQSKTFTTQETLTLAESARQWLRDAGCREPFMQRHMIAVTARADLAAAQGFAPEQTFLFWDWVGGRYSVWSAIGLPLAISMGVDAFTQLLQGAASMDEHFCHAPPERNLPLILALVGIWNINFLGASNHHVAPYSYALSEFVPYVQQLEMESNGKSIHGDGAEVDTQTCPIVWGGLGINGQHAYFQLLHQGTHAMAVDFIGVKQSNSKLPFAHRHQEVVINNMLAQAQALAVGRNRDQTLEALYKEGLSRAEATKLVTHRTYRGNVPSSIIWLNCISPHALGALMALYEHKVFCQAAIWGINAFDQWGVELGKSMVAQLMKSNLEAEHQNDH